MRYLGYPFYNTVCISMMLLFSSGSQADTNPNATLIPIANTPAGSYLHHPEISPNDSLIAFSVSGKKNSWHRSTIWVYEVASGKVWQVTREDSTMAWGDVLVRWSPDMTQLAFVSDRGGEPHAYVVDISSGAIKQLTTEPFDRMVWPNRVAWSPDGKKVLALLNHGNRKNLHFIDIKTGNVSQISDFTEKKIAGFLDLSKDGSTAIYLVDGGIETFDLASKTTRVIPSSVTESIEFPTWSPDGKWIGFQQYNNGNHTAFILPAEGGIAIEIGPGDNFWSQVPSWSSNSQELIYHGSSITPHEIEIVDINSADTLVSVKEINNVEWLWGSWSSDSKSISFIDREDSGKLERGTSGLLRLCEIGNVSTSDIVKVPILNRALVHQVPIWLDDNSGFFSVLQHENKTELGYITLPDYSIEILTDTKKIKHSISISPDQELVAYVSGEANNENIWIYDRIIGETYQLTYSTGQKATPIFSPSSDRILYHTGQGPYASLVIVNIETGDIDNRIDFNGFEYNLAWLDDNTVSFTVHVSGSPNRVWVVRDLRSDREDTIVSSNSHLIAPHVLSNGQKLLYQLGWPNGPIIIHDLNSNKETVLIEKNVRTPIVSPDGKLVAYLVPLEVSEPVSLWREDIGYIVSQNRMP